MDCAVGESKDWRTRAKERLAGRFLILDPMRRSFRDNEVDSSNEIVEFDLSELARGAYIDCLLHESQRARTQGAPLTLALLQIDGGPELLRQHGEVPFDRYMEQLGKAVQSIVRQTDLAIKYTSWALAVLLPDTPLSGAQMFAEKLKRSVSGLRPSWDGGQMTISVALAEAIARHDYDNEDIVTDLINRVEAGLEEARKRGGNEIVALEMART